MASSQETELVKDKRSSYLQYLIKDVGASLVGFADLGCLNMKITNEFPVGICFCLRHNDSAVEALPDDDSWLKMGTQLSNRARNIYSMVKEFISSQGYRYSTITSSSPPDELADLREEIPQKTLATLSGLGWIGRSALLVTPEHGPRVRIGTLITDMPLSADIPIVDGSCGNCTACVDACPVGAIEGNMWLSGIMRSRLVDVKKCNEYLWSTQPTLGRRQTCGICLKVCPLGQKHRNGV